MEPRASSWPNRRPRGLLRRELCQNCTCAVGGDAGLFKFKKSCAELAGSYVGECERLGCCSRSSREIGAPQRIVYPHIVMLVGAAQGAMSR